MIGLMNGRDGRAMSSCASGASWPHHQGVVDLSMSAKRMQRPTGGSSMLFAGSNNASTTSLRDDSFDAGKVASLFRNPVLDLSSSLSTTASFTGSGISDLRAATVAQQRQLDGLVEKVAGLLSAMHDEMVKDIRQAFEASGGEARFQSMAVANADLDRRLNELRDREGGMKEWFNEELRLVHRDISGDMHNLRGELQSLSGDVRGLHERVECELHGMHERIAVEVHGIHEQQSRLQVDEQVHLVERRQCKLEDAVFSEGGSVPVWEAAIENHCSNLREELHREVLEETCSALGMRICELEDHAARTHDTLTDALEVADSERVQKRELRLELVEVCAQRHDSVLKHLEKEVRQLRHTGSATADVTCDTLEWQRQAEERLETATAVEGRLEVLERWRKHADERSERPQEQLGPLRERLRSTEQHIETLRERIDFAVASAHDQCTRGFGGGGVLGSDSTKVAQRLEEVGEHVDSQVISLRQESRHCHQRMQDEINALRQRIESAEALAKTPGEPHRKQSEQRKSRGFPPQPPQPAEPDNRLVRGLEQLQQELEAHTSQIALREAKAAVHGAVQDLERQVEENLESTRSASQSLADELRKDMEVRFCQTQAQTSELRQEVEANAESVQHLEKDLRTELEARAEHMHQLIEEIKQQQDTHTEARTTQSQDTSQRLLGELQRDVKGHVAGSLQKCTDELHQGLSQVASLRAVCEETQRQLTELRAAQHLSSASGGNPKSAASASTVAREAASDAVGVLGRRLEERLEDRLARCDKAVASCERCSSSIEDRLQALTVEDLHRGTVRMVPKTLPSVPPEAGRCADSFATAESAGGEAVAVVATLKQRVVQQESGMADLLEENAELKAEVDCHLLEKKVSRSLAGLERAC